jgi:DNA-binding transcriptional ArsR family regulator
MASKIKYGYRAYLLTEMHGSMLHDETVADVVAAGLDGATETVLVVNPTTETVRELLRALEERVDPPTAKVLVETTLLSDLVEDFLVGSLVADLVESGDLEIRTVDETPNNFLFVADGRVTSVVEAGDRLAPLETSDPDFVADARDHYEDRCAEAEAFTPRTPPLSTVRETLATAVGEEVGADFDAILGSMDSVRGNGDGLSEVDISLLVAARNGVLLYDISKWGEDISLASKATFSRTKSRLEDAGLIDTEKVPIEVGRPRLRLVLGDDRLGEVPPAEMAERARSILAAEK